uniref:Uncharacterized protein n=1 Tax=Tetraselmis sp. GSL018 TaxID=582737 RepID=A0A061RNT9_9CHLO
MEIRGREWLHAHVVPAFELGVPYAAVALDLQLSALELLNGIEVVCPPAEERAASPAMFRMSRSSCLIHSGKLIASHMDVRETKEVWRLCWALSMFERTADHPPAVLMEDAYLPDAAAGPSAPARGEAGLPETPSAAGPSPSSGGSGGHGRVSLLIVGIGEDIVVVMLRPLGGAAAADLRGSFLVDAVTHDLSRFREEESAALAGLAARSEDAAAADAGAPPPQPGPAAALRAPRPAPEDTMLLHHISYNGVSGVLLATDSPPGELASNLAGDFVATAVQLHSLLERLRQSAFHTHHLSQASRGDLTPSAHGSPFSPFSNSPGPMWESIGTPRSARAGQRETPFSLTLSALMNAAGPTPPRSKDSPAQRMGSADPTVYKTHPELFFLEGLTEIRVRLQRHDLGNRKETSPHTDWCVTGRVDASGRELFLCHRPELALSALDAAFQICFGTFW